MRPPYQHLASYSDLDPVTLTLLQTAYRTKKEDHRPASGEELRFAAKTTQERLQAIHDRWATCLRSLPEAAFARTCVHSERGKLTLDDLLAIYAWHGAHHVAHITTLRAAKRW